MWSSAPLSGGTTRVKFLAKVPKSLRTGSQKETPLTRGHKAKYSAPGLWELLERIGRSHWPALIRGDRDWGTQANMARCEQEGMPYLFKQRLTKRTK